MKNFSHARLHCKSLNFMVLMYPNKKSHNFFFQNDVFKLQEVFSEHRIRVFLEYGLGHFQTLLIL
jgi:hypothetical protein